MIEDAGYASSSFRQTACNGKRSRFALVLRNTVPPLSRPADPLCVSFAAPEAPKQKRGCEITIISFSRSICRGGLAALIGVTGKPYPSCLSCHSHPIRPCGAPSPRGEGHYAKRQNVLGSPSGELPEGVVQANWIFRSEATRKSSETPFRTK